MELTYPTYVKRKIHHSNHLWEREKMNKFLPEEIFIDFRFEKTAEGQ